MKRKRYPCFIAFHSALLFLSAPPALGDPDPVSESTRIFDGPGFEMNGRFSPDGHDVMFALEDATGRDLYTMPINGGELRRITDREGYDGDSIVYERRLPDMSLQLLEMR